MPDPPLEVSRQQPSTVECSTADASWIHVAELVSHSSTQNSKGPSQEVVPASGTGQPGNSYRWASAYQVKEGILEGKWEKCSGNLWIGDKRQKHMHTPFVRIHGVTDLIIQEFRHLLEARSPGRTGVDAGCLDPTFTSPWFCNGACSCWWHCLCRVGFCCIKESATCNITHLFLSEFISSS